MAKSSFVPEWAVVVAAVAVAVPAATATAQPSTPRCHVVCAPSVTAMPGALWTHVTGGPVVRTGAGPAHRLASTSAFELILATSIRTPVPHLGVFGSVQWLPNAGEAHNPFTLYTADELGAHVHANAPTVTVGASVAVLDADATRGLLDLAVNVGDLFSQAARPGDRSAYTHKLDLDLVARAHVFHGTPARTYLHRAAAFGILDYVATGLPKAGDEVPAGRRFLTDARPLALIVGLALPLTPAQP